MPTLRKSWLLPSLAGCFVLSGLMACTVTTGPDTDEGIVKEDDGTSSSGGSSGTNTSSSSSGGSSSSSSGNVEADGGTCEGAANDVYDTSLECQTCVNAKCADQTLACFCASDTGAAPQCEALLKGYEEECVPFFTTQEELETCFEAQKTDNAAAATAYAAFGACQEAQCEAECFAE